MARLIAGISAYLKLITPPELWQFSQDLNLY